MQLQPATFSCFANAAQKLAALSGREDVDFRVVRVSSTGWRSSLTIEPVFSKLVVGGVLRRKVLSLVIHLVPSPWSHPRLTPINRFGRALWDNPARRGSGLPFRENDHQEGDAQSEKPKLHTCLSILSVHGCGRGTGAVERGDYL